MLAQRSTGNELPRNGLRSLRNKNDESSSSSSSMVASVLPHKQYMLGVRSLLIFEKILFVRNELASSLQPPASFFALDFQKLVDRCLNKFVQYVGHLIFERVCYFCLLIFLLTCNTV